jgi:succinylglutamate desuccinylase
VERVIGEIKGEKKGPLLIFVGGLHGNEAQGLLALENIFLDFKGDTSKLCGKAVALRGNLEAIRQGIRFVSLDLNRIWDVKHFKHAVDVQAAEVYELQAIRRIIEEEIKGDYTQVYLIDLHTTSAPTIPFAVTKENSEAETFIQQMNIPYITGLIGYLDGTMLAWMCEKGFCGLAFEAGQHQSLNSMIKHEAFVQLAMYYTGFMPEMPEDEVVSLQEQLEEELRPKSNHFKIIQRYKVDEYEDFSMKQGYTNFQRVYKGEVLATNVKGNILSEYDANIFMPLYQKQGNDGFFIIKPAEVQEAVNQPQAMQ